MKAHDEDIACITQVLRGDTARFADIVNRYERQLFAVVVRIVGNREDAEELVQDVFVKAFNSLGSFRAGSSFSTWLYRIAYNTAISKTRKKRVNTVEIDEKTQKSDFSENEMEEGFNTAARERKFDKAEIAMGMLEPAERAMVAMFYLERKPISEIAHITGFTETNVKTRLHRIRKKLYMMINGMEEQA